MDALNDFRDNLAQIRGVASCKIGIEPNISPVDYPLIRIVPSRITPGRPYGNRTVEALVYFGMDTATSEGLEQVYADLWELERAILDVLHAAGGRYIETLTDEDRLDAYKLMTIRCEITVQREQAPA